MTDLEKVKSLIEAKAGTAVKLAKDIWEFAELSFEETKSAAALIEALKAEGFEIEEGIADIPTAFTATFSNGTGKPVMGLLGEYDALDGLSQKAACAAHEPIGVELAGHGCGHNLLGSGCFAAAVAIKDYLVSEGKDGTIIYYGCPAEEGAGSKQFIARAGYFDKCDFAYSWHPGTINEVTSKGAVAIMGANFVFEGTPAHAGSTPHLGRSALDAAELMNVGVNYLREHMIDSARVHYAYSDAGGTAPNVVPGHAVIKYEVRAPKVSQVQELFTRVVDIAKGAALMTGTKMEYEITMAFSDYVANKALAGVMDEALKELGAPEWNDDDYKMATEFLYTYNKSTFKNIKENLIEVFDTDEAVDEALAKPLHQSIVSFNPKEFRYDSGSTDVGDVGYATPTTTATIATGCLGCVAHTWQWTALSNSEIGMKGMLRAAELMALSCIRVMDKPELIEAAKAELVKKNGGKYTCPLPEYVTPPIGRY